jgi:hypothetical protein
LQAFGVRFEAAKLKPMGLWRGFAVKKRTQRRSKMAAHELISVALR